MATKKTNTENKYTKEQFLNAKKPIGNVDALYAVLEDGKTYTKKEAEELLEKFLKREVK